jgi:hypothetical protein
MVTELRMAYTAAHPVTLCARRPSVFAAAACLTVWLVSPDVAAGHAPPRIVDVVQREGAGPVLVTNRGLILADTNDGPFRLLCTDATKLLHSLEEFSEQDLAQVWSEEAQRRNVELDADPDSEIPADQVFREARSRLP